MTQRARYRVCIVEEGVQGVQKVPCYKHATAETVFRDAVLENRTIRAELQDGGKERGEWKLVQRYDRKQEYITTRRETSR